MRQTALLKEIVQLGFVVNNLQRTVERYWNDFGIGPWRLYTMDSSLLENPVVRGVATAHAWRAATAEIGSIELELIEPMDDRSIYAEHLRTHGEGLHHIQVRVDNFDQVAARVQKMGYRELGSGTLCGVHYKYVDTAAALACMVEFIDRPVTAGEFAPPEAFFPRQST